MALAVVAFAVAAAMGEPELGFIMAGGIVAGEQVWNAGSFVLRRHRRL